MKRVGGLLLLILSLGGCTTAPVVPAKPILARFFLESGGEPGAVVVLPVSESRIVIAMKPVFTEFDLARVEIARVELGQCLLFQLTPAAARDLHRLAVSHRGQRLVLMIDGHPMGARRIEEPIMAGDLYLFIEGPDGSLPELQQRLQATALRLLREAKTL